MKADFEISTISDAHTALGLHPPEHPLISIVKNKTVENAGSFEDTRVVLGLYSITFKYGHCSALKYGVSNYDYQNGTLLFTSPNQVIQYENISKSSDENNEGWNLIFHPDLLRKSNLAQKIRAYTFFSYQINEGLHLSDKERRTIEMLLDKIEEEYKQNLDKHSQHLIASYLELLLDNCVRYYDRQFYTRSNLNQDTISKFENFLQTYYEADRSTNEGIPSVSSCAKHLNLSANYLSDVLKKETGKSAQERIHIFVIEQAKNKLLSTKDSISEISYELGFEYPQYFSNLFKSKTGFSPKEYRSLN